MVIDHLGIAVASIPEAIQNWKQLFGYKQYTEIVTNLLQKVNVVFLSKENSIPVKLIEPIDETSPIYLFAKRGGGLHHICFKCNDLNKSIEDIKEGGGRVIVKPQPGEAFNNNLISFILAPGNLNIELIDTTEKAKIL